MAESMIFTDNTVTTFNNTAAEQTFWSTTIPANTLGVTDALRITCWGNYENGTGAQQTMTFKLYFGATNVGTRDIQTVTPGLREACWQWYVTMRGTVALQYIVDQWSDGTAGQWAPTPPAVDQHGYAIPMDFAFGGNNITIDTSVDVVLKQTGLFETADATLAMTYYAVRVEKLTTGGGVVGGGGGGGGSVQVVALGPSVTTPIIYVQEW